MRRPASSRSKATAASSISMPRWPTGSTTISRRSAPAASSSSDIVAGEGAALLTTLAAVPGDVKTEILDIDLKTRSGHTVPARLFHKVAFGADGTPGPSRTLVLNRARDDGTDPQRAAEVRFMRFFQNTPMAIATVDKQGRIADRTRGSRGCSIPCSRARPPATARSSPSSPSATAACSKPRSARRRTGRARSPRSTPRSPARASASRASSSPRSRRRSATRRPRSSTRSRPPSSARWRTRSTSSRRWRPSAGSPATSRTTSTTCSAPS